MSFLRRLFSGFASPPINMEAAKTKAQSLIDENAVMVFSKSYCPYCRASKKTLQSAGAQFKVYELNEESQYNPPPPSPHLACPSLVICDLSGAFCAGRETR